MPEQAMTSFPMTNIATLWVRHSYRSTKYITHRIFNNSG